MSTANLCRSQALPVMAALLCASCAVGAPNAADDPFFEEQLGDDDAAATAELDAAVDAAPPFDPGLLVPQLLDAAQPVPGGGMPGAAPVNPGRDAGSQRDAASATPPRDAGTSPPPATTPPANPPATSACDPLSCTNECSVAGPFPCCTLFDTCGCTWAPGAYCI